MKQRYVFGFKQGEKIQLKEITFPKECIIKIIESLVDKGKTEWTDIDILREAHVQGFFHMEHQKDCWVEQDDFDEYIKGVNQQ